MKPTMVLYAPPGRGYDPARPGQPIYYQPVYYPYPYYGQVVNPYEAARQAEGADRIASLIWKLVLVIIACAVIGAIALVIMLG